MITDLDPPIVTFYPLNAGTREGDDVTLYCNADGNPVPTISWTRNGFAINASDNYGSSNDNKQLNIRNVNRSDSGEYRCVANNTLGNGTSSAAILVVQCK